MARTLRHQTATANTVDPMVAFGANMDRLFGKSPDGSSRGDAVIGNIRELEKSPVLQRVYTTLAILAMTAKTEGFGGSVVHFKLAEALESTSLDGMKPFEVCQRLEAEGLLRSGRSKGKGIRLWFVADLLDAPEKGAKAPTANPIADAVSKLIGQ